MFPLANNLGPLGRARPSGAHVAKSTYSLAFNGSNYVHTDVHFPLTGDPAFSISAWLYLTSGLSLLAWGGTDTLQALVWVFGYRGTNIMGLEFAGINGAWTDQALTLNTWQHLLFTKSPGAINATTDFYLDGVKGTIQPGASTGTPNIASGIFMIGSNAFGGAACKLDDVRVYDRKLSDADAAALANGGNPAVNDPLLWLPLEEGTGTTTADASGNGYTGTLVGSPTPTWDNDVPTQLQ